MTGRNRPESGSGTVEEHLPGESGGGATRGATQSPRRAAAGHHHGSGGRAIDPKHSRAKGCPADRHKASVPKRRITPGWSPAALCVLASTGQPAGDGGMSKAEDTLCSRGIQPFGQRCQHHGDLMGRGFQTVHGRVASRAECGMASLAAESLDLFSPTMLAISHQRVDLRIGVAEVEALLIGAGEPLGVDPLGCAPAAFHLSPGTHRLWCRPARQRGRGG